VNWDYEFEARALRELKSLGSTDQQRVIKYLRKRIVGPEDPRRFGKALLHEYAGLWRYRVGDIRLICKIEDGALKVLVVRVGHRREVY